MASRYGWAAAAALAGVVTVVAQEPTTPQYQRMLKGYDVRTADEYLKQFRQLDAEGKRDEARRVAEQLLALRVRAQGKDHWQVRDAEWRLRDLAEPLTDELREQHAERERLITRLKTLSQQGTARDAEPVAERLLVLTRKALGDTHPHTAGCLITLAVTYREQGKLGNAEPLLREALALYRKNLGDLHPATASCLNSLAVLYHWQGRLGDAEPLHRQALVIRRNTLGDAHPETATSLNNLAVVYQGQGRLGDAESLVRATLFARRKALGDAHPETANSLNNLSVLYHRQGKLSDAEPLALEALAITRKARGADHPEVAGYLNNLASLYRDQGKLSDAEPLFREALAVSRKELGAVRPETITNLTNLAMLYERQGKLADAEPLAQEALALSRKGFGDNHPITASSLHSLAGVYMGRMKLSDAEPLFKEALAVYRKAHGDYHQFTATSLNNLAVLHRLQHRLADAEPLHQKAVTASEVARLSAARGIDRAVVTLALPFQGLAAAQAQRGDLTSATATLDAGLARGLLDELADRRPVALTPDEAARRDRLLTDRDRLQPRVFALATRPTLAAADRAELDGLAAARAQIEDELAKLAVTVSRRGLADLAAIRNSLPPGAAWVAWLDLANGELVAESWVCVVRPAAEPRMVKLTGTGEKGAFTPADSSLPQRLRLALGGDPDAKRPPAPAADVADLAKQLRDQRIAPALPHLAGVNRVYVSAVGHMAGVPVEVLAPEFTVSYTPSGTFLAKLKDKARPAGDAVLGVGDPVFARPGAEPAAKALPPGGVLVTIVSPGGPAARAGVAPGDVLLKYGDADLPDVPALDKALAEHAGRKTVPVVVWRENQLATATRDVDAGKLGVTVSADPAPVAVANRRKLDALVAGRGGDWKELPGTRVEVDQLRRLFGDKATVLADSAASEHGLNDLRKADGLKRFRFVHLATHGEGNTVRALESSLILAQDRLPGDLVARDGEPLLDGRLTAREVLDHWHLDAELVTLSACETAIGVKAGGDGLLGFAQAFLVAGSRSVCLSLWRVDDTATALLMDRFYRNLLRRHWLARPMGKAAALAEAKAWLRELTADQVLTHAAALTNGVVRGPGQPALRLEPPAAAGGGAAKPFAHPRYWAAFILVGDPN